MTIRPRTYLLSPLLALSLALGFAGSVRAQDRATLQVTFGTRPHWTTVRGTRVREIRSSERPDYDMFRYGNRYYAYTGDRWYYSNRDRGEYQPIDDREVPRELARVPRDHWHHYPQTWQDRDDHRSDDHRSDDRHR